MPCNRRRSDERNCANKWMIEEGIDRIRTSIDKVHHTGWQPKRVDHLHSALHRHRAALRWFDDVSVSTCYRIWQIPERNHGWEIEWRNRSAYSHRLAYHELIDATCN